MSRAPRTSAITLAASVLPTPASPSMKSGFSSFRARKIEVARPRSPMYLRSRRRDSTSSMVAGEPLVTPTDYEVARRRTEPPLSLTRLLDRPLGQHPSEVLLVLGAGSPLARSRPPIRRVLRRFLWLGALLQRVLDGLGADRRRSYVRQADAPTAVHLLGRGADYRTVEQTAAELDVLVRTIRHREDDLGNYLVGAERSGEQVLEEILGGDSPTVGHDLSVEHEGDGRIVARGIRVCDHSTDSAHVAYLVVPDLTRHLGENRQLVLDDCRVLDFNVPRQRADAHFGAVGFDVVELFDSCDVDQRFRLGEAKPHQRDQAVPARQHLGVLPVSVQQL